MWKQPKLQVTDEWIKKMWAYAYNGILFSPTKETLQYMTTRMDVVDIILIEISQTQTDKTA